MNSRLEFGVSPAGINMTEAKKPSFLVGIGNVPGFLSNVLGRRPSGDVQQRAQIVDSAPEPLRRMIELRQEKRAGVVLGGAAPEARFYLERFVNQRTLNVYGSEERLVSALFHSFYPNRELPPGTNSAQILESLLETFGNRAVTEKIQAFRAGQLAVPGDP